MRRPRASLAILFGGLALLGPILAACGDKDDNTPAATSSAAPLPAPPAWASAYIGKTQSDFQTSKDCQGAFDIVSARHTGTDPGVEVQGWAWLTQQNAAPDKIIFVGPSGPVIGAAEINMDRPDVPKAIDTIKTSKVGWHGVVKATDGKVLAFAVLPDQSICQIGQKDIGA